MAGYTRKPVDKTFERRFIIGMIVSDKVIREMLKFYNPDFIASQPARIVIDWCIKYFEQYEKAPMRQIQDIYDDKEKLLDEDVALFVEDLLNKLNEEWERTDKFNEDFILDEAEKYFKGKSLLMFSAQIRDNVAAGNIAEAEALQDQYKRVERQKSSAFNPFTDQDMITRAINVSDQEPLFRLPGVLGEVMNPQFVRSGFVALQGPEKRGKSFWIDEIAVKAYRSRCHVAVFDLGDMTEEQRTARLHCHIAMKPLEKFNKGKSPIAMPVLDCLLNQDDTCALAIRKSKVGVLNSNGTLLSIQEAYDDGYKPCHVTTCKNKIVGVWYEEKVYDSLTVEDAINQGDEFYKRTGKKNFKMSFHNNSTMNIKGIDAILEMWKNTEGFVPDVICIDYPAIAAPEDYKQDQRNRVNDTWKAMRKLAQKWKACVVTVDQTDADSYDQESIKLKNFTEDKRKYGHVTAMYSLNQTDEERKAGVMRIGELLIREGEAQGARKVFVLECRKLGRINLGSYI